MRLLFLVRTGIPAVCLGENRLDILQLHVLPGQVDPGHPAQVVGGVAPVVEDPPVAVEVGAAHRGELFGDGAGRVLAAGQGLDDSQDAKRHVAGEEVRLDVLLPGDVDRPGLEVALGDLEGLLDFPKAPVGLDNGVVAHVRLGGDDAVVAVAGLVRGQAAVVELERGGGLEQLAGPAVDAQPPHVLGRAEVRGGGVGPRVGDQPPGLVDRGLALLAGAPLVLLRPEGDVLDLDIDLALGPVRPLHAHGLAALPALDLVGDAAVGARRAGVALVGEHPAPELGVRLGAADGLRVDEAVAPGHERGDVGGAVVPLVADHDDVSATVKPTILASVL